MLSNLEVLQSLSDNTVFQLQADGTLLMMERLGQTTQQQLDELVSKKLIRKVGERYQLTQKGYEASLPDQIA